MSFVNDGLSLNFEYNDYQNNESSYKNDPNFTKPASSFTFESYDKNEDAKNVSCLQFRVLYESLRYKTYSYFLFTHPLWRRCFRRISRIDGLLRSLNDLCCIVISVARKSGKTTSVSSEYLYALYKIGRYTLVSNLVAEDVSVHADTWKRVACNCQECVGLMVELRRALCCILYQSLPVEVYCAMSRFYAQVRQRKFWGVTCYVCAVSASDPGADVDWRALKLNNDSLLAVPSLFDEELYTHDEFTTNMNTLQVVQPDAYQKLYLAGLQRWSRAYCLLVRYNYMTSNGVESVNELL
ncbi:hypothetical protein Tco_0868438 [Tanacetum coccineum]